MLYQGEYTREIVFPLGGIGSGSIGLDGTGRLVEWEIFNRPAKGTANGYSHIAVKAKNADGIVTRVLNGDMDKTYLGRYHGSWSDSIHGTGMPASLMGGFPHFPSHTFTGEFPIAKLDFADDSFPADVSLQAFNPFIPLDAENSSLPGAFFAVEITNTSTLDTEYQVAFSVQNPFDTPKNQAHEREGYPMISLKNDIPDLDSPAYGELTIATDCLDTLHQSYWYRGAWKDHVVTFWREFSSEDDLRERIYEGSPPADIRDVCTLVAKVHLQPGEAKTVHFVLTWNVPNYENYWDKPGEGGTATWKNYYATVFADSTESAAYSLRHWEELQSRTETFHRALHDTSLDSVIVEAISANLAVLKSPTVLRLEDGSFWGWEGVTDLSGSCPGTCQHVWNYAYALCFLFPELERSIRNAEFRYGTLENGRTTFRLTLPYGSEPWDFRPCVDGQMGTVIKFYREWKLSGDDAWMREHWDTVKAILAYAWHPDNPDGWDRDKDGVLEGRQHHTLDMELYGPSSWLQGMYLAALQAAAEIADYLGETDMAAEYRTIYESGYAYTRDHLFNGAYFIQNVDLHDKSLLERYGFDARYWNEESGEIKYQIADGSSIDQLLGLWHTRLVGLAPVFDEAQVNTALKSMMQYNYKSTVRDFVNPWRLFAVNDEAGAVICDYPHRESCPAIPISYCEETMTGFEYAFAGLLVAYGMTEEATTVVRSIRARYDGKKRNPWSEIECGNHYARSMASFALLPLFSGFQFDLPHSHMGFCPVIQDGDFRCPWFLGGGWGEFTLTSASAEITVREGSVVLGSLSLSRVESIRQVCLDGERVPFTVSDGCVRFEKRQIHRSIQVQFA